MHSDLGVRVAEIQRKIDTGNECHNRRFDQRSETESGIKMLPFIGTDLSLPAPDRRRMSLTFAEIDRNDLRRAIDTAFESDRYH